jgi:DNA polymerase I-like protein with 3'-5' exonuclease and polymerase domains
MGMEMPEWDEIDDTMFLLFLWDPHAPDLKLKPSAERILDLPPEEQDEMVAWLLKNKRRLLAETDIGRWKDGKGRAYINSKARVGALVAYAPGTVAGRYACGDTDRTLALFKHLWPRIVDKGMEAAYDRERQIMPILLENEKIGVRVDVGRLAKDVAIYEPAADAADAWLRKRLKAPSLNIDSDADFADALSRAGIVRDEDWILTPTGARSVSKNNLRPELFTDQRVARAFGYRNRLTTCLNMFMRPWLAQAQRRGDGYISTNWNQVRQPNGGTRTGRPSTTDPNFLNLSKTWDDKNDGYNHPVHIVSLPELPLVRRYVLADKGGVFLHRDFDGQELRIAAHFEDGPLMAAYQKDPHLDVHDHVRGLIASIAGLDYHRTQVKVTNFRRIYGGGAPATSAALGIPIDVAKELLAAHGKALPGLRDLNDRITAIAKAGEPIITWGGREYYVEEPKLIQGRMVHFFYKLLNYLVQGSAADCTKEAMIRYYNHPARDSRFLVQVYDEINISTFTKNKSAVAQQMSVLRESMESIELDVPMLSTGKIGSTWCDLVKYKEIPYAQAA